MINEVNGLENNELDPEVKQFKAFINKDPELIKEIRQSGRPLQEYYDEWKLQGQLKGDEKLTEKQEDDMFEQIIGLVSNIDSDKMQGYVKKWGQTFKIIQGLFGSLHEEKDESKNKVKNYNQTYLYRD